MSVAVQQNQLSLDSLSEDKIDLLKRTICKGASNDELELFIHACNRMQLDPFMRQIHAVKRFDNGKETMSIQTGIDGYRLLAERTGKYMPGRECTFEYKDGKILSATSYVKKLGPDNEWHEIASTVYWEEYAAKKKDGTLTAIWRDKPHVMLGKCAESSVLRKAFPADLSGVYTKEEMEQAEHPDVSPISPQGEIISAQVCEELISDAQAQEIENLLASEDKQYKDDLLKYFSNARKLQATMTSFFGLPKKYHQGCLRSIYKRHEDRSKKRDTTIEVAQKDEQEETPF